MTKHTPRKRFGQNFLIDNNIIANIIAAIDPKIGQHIVEVGPGQGVLTAGLVASKAKIDAIEIDRDLVDYLQKRFNHSNFTLHNMDVLKFALQDLKIVAANKKLRIVGNLPYNISTPLLFKLFTNINLIEDMFFMLQHEVAVRLAAQPNSKDYGRMSVMAQYYCNMQIIIEVPPTAFSPAPKVDSSVVHFMPHPQPIVIVSDEQLFYTIVTQAFGQRRKTISNSLKPFLNSAAWNTLGINPQLRAENLTIHDFANIANYVAASGK